MIKRSKHTKRVVYEYLERYIAANSEAPTIAEIGKHFEMKSPASVHKILVALEREGLIKRTPNISRGIAIAPHRSAPMVGWLDR